MPRMLGQLALFLSLGTLWVMAGCGGSVRPPDLTGQLVPLSVSDRIVFSRYDNVNWRIFVANPDGTGQFNLTKLACDDYDPAWSPDSQHLVFISDRKSNADLYVMDLPGGAVQRLTFNGNNKGDPTWSPDGTQIVFSERRGDYYDLWRINPDGTGLKRLTTSTCQNYRAAWLPDSSGLVFSSNRKGNYSLFQIDRDGSNMHRVTFGIYNDTDPAIAPDVDRIVFASDRKGGGLFTVKLDGTNMGKIPNTGPYDRHPSWGPGTGGGVIVFHSNKIGKNQIYKIATEGTMRVRLIINNRQDSDPNWGAVP